MMPLLELGPSRALSGRIALALGIVALAMALLRDRSRLRALHLSSRSLLTLYAALAFFLSCVYVVQFLHFGPRIVDATSYFLEARALAEGHLAFSVPEPTAAFR